MCDNLTPKQRECIEYMCEHLDATQRDVAAALGLHYNTINKWVHQPLFQDTLERELHTIFRSAQKVALNTMITLASNGDRQAAQYVLDNVGYKVADKVELNTNDISIKIIND